MDKADMRRGNATVHKKWNENAAILSGDGMLVLAYRYLVQSSDKDIRKILGIANETFTGIMEGQQYDMEFETRDDVTEAEYIEMIRLKTSVLLAACTQMGAVLGGASDADASLIYEFGEKVGIAFQLQDDLLDVYGDPAVFGKKIGGDTNPKPTDYAVRLESTIGVYGTALLDAIDDEEIEKQWASEARFTELNPAMWDKEANTFKPAAYYSAPYNDTGKHHGSHGPLKRFTYAMTRGSLQDGAGSNAVWNITNVTRSDRHWLYDRKRNCRG